MILAVDVHYKKGYAKSVGLSFQIESDKALETYIVNIFKVKPYESGKFYKRELPCILELIKQINLETIDIIIVDGHVYIDNNFKYGLGGFLYAALQKKIPIIGVAKKSLKNNSDTVIKVFRGVSKKPLFVSSIGLEINKASNLVRKMKGRFRIPTILKKLDSITKTD